MAQLSAQQHRLRRWPRVKDRLMQPVSALDYSSRLKRRSSRTSQSSKDTDITLGDDMYFGGELPEDPFMRGPLEILGRPRTNSAPSSSYRKSYLERKPLPLVPPSARLIDDAALLVMVAATTREQESDGPDLGKSRSGASSPSSDTTFHTCESAASETQEGNITPDTFSFGDIPHEWHHDKMTHTPIEALPELTYTGDGSSDQDAKTFNSPRMNSASVAQFEKFAEEELSPLSLIAASMAYNRRASCSLRRATSSPLLQVQPRRVLKHRIIISCPLGSTAPKSRPPSYASGQESVPTYCK